MKLTGHVNKIIIQTLGSQSLEIIIGFFRNMMLIRYIGGETYGKYQFIVAALALMDMSFLNVDIILRRFLPVEESVLQKKIIIWSNIAFKHSAFLIMIFGLIFFTRPEGFNLRIVVLLTGYFYCSNILNTAQALAQSLEIYSKINFFNSLNTLLGFLALTFVYVFLRPSSLDFLAIYIVINVLVALANIAFSFQSIRKMSSELFSFPRGINYFGLIDQGIWKYKAYYMPTVLTGISGYLKSYLPSILLGRAQQFEGVAYFEIVKKIYGIIHKLIPNVVRSMMTTLLKKKQDPAFIKKWRNYTLAYLGLMALAGVIAYVLSPLVLRLYRIPFYQDAQFLFYIYAFYLTIGAWALAIGFLVHVSESTVSIFFTSLARQIYIIIAYYFIAKSLSVRSLAIIIVSSAFVSLFYMLHWLWKNEKRLLLLQLQCLILMALQVFVMTALNHFNIHF